MFNYPPSIKASIVAVSEEPDLNGKPMTVYNIKVVKDFEGSTLPMTWNVVRSLKDFQENHTVLKVKYGLLKKFEFKSKKVLNMIRRKSSVDADDQHVAQYLEELVVLNPIPDEVISLLALENVRYAEKEQLRQQRRSRSSDSKKDISSALAAEPSSTLPPVDAETLQNSDSFSDFQKISKSEDSYQKISKEDDNDTSGANDDPDGVWKDVPDSPEALKEDSTEATTSFKALTSTTINSPSGGVVAPAPATASGTSTAVAAKPTDSLSVKTPESTLRQRGKKEIRAPAAIQNFFSDSPAKKVISVTGYYVSTTLTPEQLQKRCESAVYYTASTVLLFGFCSLVFWLCRGIMGIFYPSLLLGSIRGVTAIYTTRLVSLVRFFFQLGVLCMYVAYFHRLLGVAASFLLQTILGTHTEPGKGKFNIEFRYIALRLGLDVNQIVIGNIVWHNTSAFKSTPCLLSVDEIIVTLDIASLYYLFLAPHLSVIGVVPGAVNGSLPIVINEILINNVNIFVEKTANAKDGLNLFAALGAENSHEEQSLQQYILSNMAAVAVSGKKVADMVVKYNPASLLLQAATGNISSKRHKSKRNKTASGAGGADGGADEVESSADNSAGEEGGRSSTCESGTASEYYDESTAEESATEDNKSTKRTVTTPTGKAKAGAAGKEKAKPPLLLLIHKLIIFELLVHAQDFLNASHVSHADAKPIHVVLLTMTDKELNKKNRRYKENQPRSLFNSPRSGIPPKDFVWRLLNALSKALLQTNKMAIMQILSGAAFNQTTSAVFSAGKGLVSGVTGGAALGTNVVKSGGKAVANVASAGGNAVMTGGSAVVAGGTAVVKGAGNVVSGVVGTAVGGVSGVGKRMFGGGASGNSSSNNGSNNATKSENS